MAVVWIVSAAAFVLFFPVFVSVAARFDAKSKRLTFCVGILFFRIVGGYCDKCDSGVFIHTRKDKAKSFGKKDFRLGSLKLLKAFSLRSVKIAFNVVPENYLYLPFLISFRKIFNPPIITAKPLLETRMKLNEGKTFSVAAKIEAYVSIASLLFVLSEVIWKKIKRVW